MISTMKKLDYPFSLQKSSFTNFSLTSWPIVLGVLEYLLRRAQQVVSLADDDDDDELDSPICRDKENDPFELILNGYKQFMSQAHSDPANSDHYQNEINDNIVQDYQDFKLQGFEDDEKFIEQAMQNYAKENELFDQRSKEKLNLEAELDNNIAKSNQIDKYQKYEDQMEDFHKAALVRHQETMIESSNIKKELEKDIGILTEQIGDKETALDLRMRIEAIHAELGRKIEEKLGVEKIKTNLDISVSKEKASINEEIQTYNCMILDNEIDKKYLIESNHQFKVLPASEEIFLEKIQLLKTEITERRFKQQKAEFSLKEYTTKKKKITTETEDEKGKFERKKRQAARLVDVENTKNDRLGAQIMDLLDQSEELETLKNEERAGLAELTKYNADNALDKIQAKIEKAEQESHEILIDNLIKCQDEVIFMDEEMTKLLNSQIEERLQQIKIVENQISKCP